MQMHATRDKLFNIARHLHVGIKQYTSRSRTVPVGGTRTPQTSSGKVLSWLQRRCVVHQRKSVLDGFRSSRFYFIELASSSTPCFIRRRSVEDSKRGSDLCSCVSSAQK